MHFEFDGQVVYPLADAYYIIHGRMTDDLSAATNWFSRLVYACR